jgi:hypothetical protein
MQQSLSSSRPFPFVVHGNVMLMSLEGLLLRHERGYGRRLLRPATAAPPNLLFFLEQLFHELSLLLGRQ